MPPLFVLASGGNKKNTTPMNLQLAAIGELFIHLRPNDEELKKYGTRHEYQRQIIFQLIEELGVETQVFIEPPIPRGTSGRNQILPKFLHQCVHLLYVSDFIIIPNTPEINSPRLYRYNWTHESSLTTIVLTSRQKQRI